jgi:hypothetical protein
MEHPDEYEDPIAGISVTKPPHWVYVSAALRREYLERVDLGDAEFEQIMRQRSTAPLVSMARHAEPFDDLNPTFQITERPAENPGKLTTLELMRIMLERMAATFRHAVVEEAPREEFLCGLPAAYARLDYTVRANDEEFPTASQMWLVSRGESLIIIGASTRQDERTGKRDEIEAIFRSVKITGRSTMPGWRVN